MPEITQDKSWGARSRKELGLLYRAVDWNSVEASLRPPYRLFTPGLGVQTLTKELLEKWDSTPFAAGNDE
jgi:hypothetical protein